MSKRATRKLRAVTFRMPAETYEFLAAYAAARGIDTSATLNLLISEGLPVLRAEMARIISKAEAEHGQEEDRG